MGDGLVYKSSTGAYYGDADIWDRFESGEWKPCCWDPETGKEWIMTDSGDLLLLLPISRHLLPAWTTVDDGADGVRISGAHPITAEL